jgi:ComF family protein
MLFDGILTLVAPPRCAGCDEPSDEAALFCGACEASVERGGDPGAVFEYGGPVAEAIHRFKYDGRSELGFALGSVMAEQALRLADKVDGVVPVPLHWRRRRARGYDQSVLLCRPVAEALGVPALLRGLRRLKNTSSQVDLPHRERHRNVAGAFAPWRLHGARRVLLVDDVRTTGATLEAASRALKAGGVSQVHPFVLAARVLTRCT